MPTIVHHQIINAPPPVCFDLARDVLTHTETTSQTNEVAVSGRTKGLMEVGEIVAWQGTHFGVRQHLTAKVTRMEKYHFFEDVMVKGAFQSFTHTHEFKETLDGGTVMTDVFEYQSPFGLLGRLADLLFLEKYMKKLLTIRANELKVKAERQR
ncbi:SRPBCC family protein [Halobacillus locisalis]|uniref:SRPBCC family protein n=1 Tax=Halobacillus locisalis TaxID=220753 RepID=A0A838CNT3_9BACI|nr:SRPBCC family protein [Halobacillus locisalis]MBA2173717.1 SRPBCC family protein [Halobacillus locisalis]